MSAYESVHLVRRDHDSGATCWCGEESPIGWQDGAASEEIDEATCLPCLMAARLFGAKARERHEAVRDAIAFEFLA